jgi:uncharacterized protein
VSELPGLPVQLVAGGGPLHVHVQFGREQGHIMAQVALRGELLLVCQRCMKPMSWRVDSNSPVLLIEAESQADGAPVEWETYLAVEGRVSLGALAAEELMLALPIVPLHANAKDCGAAASLVTTAEQNAPVQDMSRPFADLRALLEGGAKPRN